MSNFTCPHCGMINIDCGKAGYKTPREIELENKLKGLRKDNDNLRYKMKLYLEKIKTLEKN